MLMKSGMFIFTAGVSRGPYLIRGKYPWKLRKKSIFFPRFFEFLTLRMLHRSSTTIGSYGDCFLAISMDIYHELSKDPD